MELNNRDRSPDRPIVDEQKLSNDVWRDESNHEAVGYCDAVSFFLNLSD